MISEIGKFRLVFLVVVAWLFYALFFASQTYISNLYFGREVSVALALFIWVPCAVIWMLLTPVVYKLASGFPFERGRLHISIPVHFLAGCLLSFITLNVYVAVRLILSGRGLFAGFELNGYLGLLVSEFHVYVLLYFVLIGLYNLQKYYWQFRERHERAMQLEVEAARLETQLAQAQLNALRMQIHPHFLFNTLNSISVLMPEDPAAANKMLLRLSELLRVALRSEATQIVTLEQELDFLRDYLAIEQTRFQDRLCVDFQIDDAALDASVPNLILQPLVENAIKHGIAPRSSGGRIDINALRSNGHPEIEVSDDGLGVPFGDLENLSEGVGLSNTRRRLRHLYGNDHRFDLKKLDSGGLGVSLEIPFKTAG